MKRYLKLDNSRNSNEHDCGSEYCCQEMMDTMSNAAFDLAYRKRFAETYTASREGDGICWQFDFCPFCGKNVASKHDIFNKCIKDELGIDVEDEGFDHDTLDERLPLEFHTDEWWKKRGL